MKIIPTLQTLEYFSTRIKSKKSFHKKIKKGDLVSIIYFELDKEQIRLQQFIGFCLSFTSKSLNTKIRVSNSIGKIGVIQKFFLYSPSLIDMAILRRK